MFTLAVKCFRTLTMILCGFLVFIYIHLNENCEENSLSPQADFVADLNLNSGYCWIFFHFEIYYYYLQVSSPTIIVERAGSFAWTSRSWRVREEFARTVTSAIGLFSSTELPLQRAILPPVCSLNFTNKQYMFFSFFLFPKKVHVFLLFNISWMWY